MIRFHPEYPKLLREAILAECDKAEQVARQELSVADHDPLDVAMRYIATSATEYLEKTIRMIPRGHLTADQDEKTWPRFRDSVADNAFELCGLAGVLSPTDGAPLTCVSFRSYAREQFMRTPAWKRYRAERPQAIKERKDWEKEQEARQNPRPKSRLDALRLECGWAVVVLAEKVGKDVSNVADHISGAVKMRGATAADYATAFTRHLGRTVTPPEVMY